MNLERAKAMLAARKVDRDMKCFGIPVQEFDRDDLITMLAMSIRETECERKIHSSTMGMLTACSRQRTPA